MTAQEARVAEAVTAQEARVAEAVTAQEARVGNAVSEQGKRLEEAVDSLGRKIGHTADIQVGQIISSFAAQERQMNLALDSFAHGMEERIYAMRQMQESFDAALRQGMTSIHAMAEETCQNLKKQAGWMETVNGAVYDKMDEMSGTVERLGRHMEANIESMDKIIRNLYEESDIRMQAAARQAKAGSGEIFQEIEEEGEKLEADKKIP